jgi:hypothetical protein
MSRPGAGATSSTCPADQLDPAFQKAAQDHFFPFDFKRVADVPAQYYARFDFVLIDPPFITKEVWQAYADAVRLITRPGARVLCSTIDENAGLLKELLGVERATFRPLIPNLVYQYSLFANYQHAGLEGVNEEVGF